MSKMIKVSDEIGDILEQQASSHFRTMGGQIEYLLSLDNSSEKNNKKISEGAVEFFRQEYPKIAEVVSTSRTPGGIVKEINAIQEIIDNADTFNQDPDYWEKINEKKTKVEDLWAEWHLLTGK